MTDSLNKHDFLLRLPLLVVVMMSCSGSEQFEPAEGAAVADEAPVYRDGKADFFGKGTRIDDRLQGMQPLVRAEIVAELDAPPGNITSSDDGRIFLTFHPDAHTRGHVKVGELVGDDVVAFPSDDFQRKLNSVLSVRIDRQQRMWLLDHGDYGFKKPRLWAIDLASRDVVIEYEFPSTAAPLGSMLNDFQVSADGLTVFISDQSPIRKAPGIVVVDFDREHPIARRRLHKHPSVVSGDYDVFVDDKLVEAFGFVRPDYGIDGITLSPDGEWIYYTALNQGELYRIRAEDLEYQKSLLLDADLEPEHVASIPLSDGIAIDHAGNVYITAIEHGAVARVRPDGSLDKLAEHELLRWPDGFGWLPSGELLVTASALQHVLPEVIKSRSDIDKHGPYHVFVLDPSQACDPASPCFGQVGH